jgi:hypothetical protein
VEIMCRMLRTEQTLAGGKSSPDTEVTLSPLPSGVAHGIILYSLRTGIHFQPPQKKRPVFQ